MEEIINFLNNNRVFSAFMILILNIGGKYLVKDIPNMVDKIFENTIMRKIVIFSVIFISTRDIKISIFMTLIFILIFGYLLNEKSRGCIIKNIMRK